jgi:hypothetical protein
MHKFKVGDKVQVRKDLVHGKTYHSCWFNGNDGMNEYKGRNTYIEDINPDGFFKLSKCGHWEWSDEMIIPLDKEKLDLSHVKVYPVAKFLNSLNKRR